MSRAESLELLGTIIDDLEPIGQMTPGQPLQATDWNTITSAVANLARLVVSRERTTDALLDERYAPVGHSHTGQVTLAWFDPQARALLEENMSGEVEQRAALQSLRNEVGSLKQSIDALQSQVDDIRIQVDGLRDEDASRRREISNLSLQVEGLADVEENVAVLGNRFDAIGANLEEALAFRDELVDEDGNLIDVAGLDQRVDDLESLRDNLRLADGSLVNIREIESTLARLEEDSINRNDVDNVILERLRAGDILDEAGLIDTITEQVETGFNEQFTLLTETSTELSTNLDDLGTRFTARAEVLSNLESGLQSARTTLNTLTGIPNQVAAHEARLRQTETRVQAHDNAIADLPSMRQRLSTVEERTSLIDPLSADIDGLTGRMQSVESDLGQLAVLSGRVDTVSTRLGTIENDMTRLSGLQGQVTLNVNALRNLGQRVNANEAQLNNLESVPDDLHKLAATTEELAGWRITAERRFEELGFDPQFFEVIAGRLDTLESTAAENGVTVRRIDQSVASIENVLPELQALPDQFKGLNTRVFRLERGGIPIRP